LTIRYGIKNKPLSISNKKSVADLKLFIDEIEDVKNFNHEKIRLFYGGKELKNGEELWTYNITEDAILQMMYSK